MQPKRRKTPRKVKRPFPRKKRALRINPGSDPRLKRVFSQIGIPEKSEFIPDPFQVRAVEAAKQGDCLVTAPTGAGKTWIAVQAIAHVFNKDQRAWYASPLKALSNSKYVEFCEIFGAGNVGILTGDRKVNPDAPIIVGTTEILRNQLYDAMHMGHDLGAEFVVLDEAHFLGDFDRGVVWEEIMIYLPSRIPLLMLSATIGNAGQIAAWLESIRGAPCALVEETRRPVPLYHLFLHPSGTLYPLIQPSSVIKKKKLLDKRVRNFLGQKKSPGFGSPHRLPPFGEVLGVLKKYNLLPAIFFLKSRADCDHAVEMCEKCPPLDPEKKERIYNRIREMAEQSPYILTHRQLDYLQRLTVGAHHSGQLPIWKQTLETLMTEGLMSAVFATSTVAAGVNFPARTIVFLNSDRFNGHEFLPLSSTEFHQMTGRAGRRGMDKIGFAVLIPGRFMDPKLVARLAGSPPSDVLSQIRINFSMVLNLLMSHTLFQVRDLLKNSFAAFLIAEKWRNQKKAGRQQEAHQHLWTDFLRHHAFLKANGFVDEDDGLTKDGTWASQLRVDQPLMIAEGFRKKAFPENDPALLAAIFAAFVNEREFDDRMDAKGLDIQVKKALNKMRRKLSPFVKKMKADKFEVRELYLRPAVAVFAWASGLGWDKVWRLAEMEEGNFVMLVLRTADNLRHVQALWEVFPKAAADAREALDLILKDPVLPDYEAENEPPHP